MSRSKNALALCAGLSISVLMGCAHKNQDQAAAPAAKSAAPAKAAEAKPTAQAIPKGHVFGKITNGMAENDVRKLLGEPSDRRDYVTGKAWIPYYYGKDTSRSDWIYKGKGHVVFSRNRYNGALTVIEVLYDPKTP